MLATASRKKARWAARSQQPALRRFEIEPQRSQWHRIRLRSFNLLSSLRIHHEGRGETRTPAAA
jgi:hypothetical protein